MNNFSKPKGTCILIIGASLGGLALAQGLVKAGFKVKVFERDQSAISRVQGVSYYHENFRNDSTLSPTTFRKTNATFHS